ncbi:glycoside hydrolase superfamily, partial [Gorgonomyces haynaldii]
MQTPKIMFGVDLDTSQFRDTPTSYMERTRLAPSFYCLGLSLPLQNTPPVQLIDDTNTNAQVCFSVYPLILSPLEKDLQSFVQFLLSLNRKILLKFGPDMNGSWYIYGQRPSAFKQLWIRLQQRLSDRNVPVELIWSPAYGLGYPFSNTTLSPNSTDLILLDTNQNGILDALDDPYLPYYPGDNYVDWVGLPFTWNRNQLPPNDYFTQFMGNQTQAPFYPIFSLSKNKPFMITEFGAGFQLSKQSVQLDPGPGELAIKQALWKQLFGLNLTLSYPNLVAVSFYEWQLEKDGILTDYRLTQNT